MSKLSIYEPNWLNIVFENRNKEYGAYQLRQESTKTSLFALFMGVLFLFGALSIPRIINFWNPDSSTSIAIPEYIAPVQLIDIAPNEIKKTAKHALPEVKSQNTAAPIQSDQLTNPIIVEAALASPDVIKNIQNSNTATITTDGSSVIGANASSSSGNGIENTNGVDLGNTIVTSVALDKLPEFPGGINKFYSYVGNNFEKTEIENSGSIRIFVSFVIEKDGSMTDIQVKKDPGYGLGKEAIRVLKSLKTKWSPGMIDGKAVRTAYNLPITVQME